MPSRGASVQTSKSARVHAGRTRNSYTGRSEKTRADKGDDNLSVLYDKIRWQSHWQAGGTSYIGLVARLIP